LRLDAAGIRGGIEVTNAVLWRKRRACPGPAPPGVLQHICTIVGRKRGVDRTTKAQRQRIEIDKHQRTHCKAQKRTDDALPKQVEKVIETGNALATEAKGLGRARLARQDRATSPVTVIPTTAGEAWLIHYADVEVEQIEKIEVLPHVGVTWHWRCGFYPGCEPGEIRGGDAATFGEARAAFEAAWRIFRAGCTEADFQAWREDRDWHARKYAMWERGEKLPSQLSNSMMLCPCGSRFDSHRLEDSLIHVPHITEHHREIRNRAPLRRA
jgi:hypothetical protein